MKKKKSTPELNVDSIEGRPMSIQEEAALSEAIRKAKSKLSKQRKKVA
jgi:hypothetical protein